MLEHRAVVGPFQCNCRLLACERTGEAVLVDPGDDPVKIKKMLERADGELKAKGAPGLKLGWLLHTHAHLDHIGATRAIKEAYGASVIALHRGDAEIYKALPQQGQMFGMEYDDPMPVEHWLEDEEKISSGSIKLEVLHTPGHSPGGVSFRLSEDSAAGARETVFTGDTLFQGSVGRTDLWGADQDQMFLSIRERLLTLDDDTRVCPGHGADSRIGIERRENPFLQ